MTTVPNSKHSMTVRAIDIGCGRTKFTTSDRGTWRSFPSIAPRTQADRIAAKIVTSRHTVEVCVDGMTYEVGPHTTSGARHGEIALRYGENIETPKYRALLYGALHTMQVDHLDLLVTGLPLHQYSTHHDALKQALKGTHTIRPGVSVEIADVKVVPQPVGGLLAYLLEHGGDRKRQMDRTYLLVDAGYTTFGWLCTEGLNEIPGRSGSVICGMSEYLSEIENVLGRVLGRSYPYRQKIDEGLRKGRFRVSGREFDLQLLRLLAEPVVDRAVEAMCDYVGVLRASQEVDQVVIVGGASEYFAPGLMRAFPERNIHTVMYPVYANIRGFYWIGEILSGRESELEIAECLSWIVDPAKR